MNRHAGSKSVSIPADERLIFALDVNDQAEAKTLVHELKRDVKFFKIGLELFLVGGLPLVREISDQGARVFLDLKFLDVPETVYRSLKVIETVITAGSEKSVFATIHAFNEAFDLLRAGLDPRLKVLVVTLLTSKGEPPLLSPGIQMDVMDFVKASARRAVEMGCAGVVCSGLEAFELKKTFGKDFLVVTPGIRPSGVIVKNDDQKRIVTPREAIMNGADYIVVGRPIRDNPSPVEAAQAIQREITEALQANLELESKQGANSRSKIESSRVRVG
ncbi:MAG: orotidine-5'-phosphate decarboxylase [SAR324 cluster bacterium]